MMYGFCSNNALYSASFSFTMWHIEVLPVKQEGNIVLYSFKHEQKPFPDAFIIFKKMSKVEGLEKIYKGREWTNRGQRVYRRGV